MIIYDTLKFSLAKQREFLENIGKKGIKKMTNAEKYLKEGINKEELFTGIAKTFFSECTKNDIARLNNFFNGQVKPTLTEDERVILRNIDKRYITIGRYEDGILEFNRCVGHYSNSCYPLNHLFQFIKERRRIRDRGVVKR